MQFCAQCGSLLKSVAGTLQCSCGHRQDVSVYRIVERLERPAEIVVVDRQVNSLAVHEHACARCGFTKAEILSKGTIVTDEDEFFMYRCGKCGYTEKADGLKVT
jgi:DNA-directed RNA polymerase subunit M/transcription elongation factor TFIIS